MTWLQHDHNLTTVTDNLLLITVMHFCTSDESQTVDLQPDSPLQGRSQGLSAAVIIGSR